MEGTPLNVTLTFENKLRLCKNLRPAEHSLLSTEMETLVPSSGEVSLYLNISIAGCVQ